MRLSTIPLAPPDPIFGIEALFRADTRPEKINLAIGVYRVAGKTHLFEAVVRAEQQLAASVVPKDYLAIDGDARFVAHVAHLVLPGHPLVCGSQTVGGTGALRLAADLLVQSGYSQILLPQPTWANHTQIMMRAGLQLASYPYYSMQDHGLSWQPLLMALRGLEGQLVLFHACCHNPTGADPTAAQWEELAELCQQRQLFPLFDLAYQGFGDGIEEDVAALEPFRNRGIQFAVAVSFAKCMGLYGERVGALLFHLDQPEVAEPVSSQLRQIVRPNYSNPPRHGVQLARAIFEGPELCALWRQELDQIRQRIQGMRQKLAQAMGPQYGWLAQQKGLFSCLGMETRQVERLREEQALYLGPAGRINIAGLPEERLEQIAHMLVHHAS
jgi:aspartate/tyrosine/aromatic aminotransferase